MDYDRKKHSAVYTQDYVFNQLIPYIGNKRKLLGLIRKAVEATDLDPRRSVFWDAFSGSGVVSRMAKTMGFEVISNDWEPYTEIINRAYIETNQYVPFFGGKKTYQDVLDELNALSPVDGWVTQHLCPQDDVDYDIKKDRMFYMRKNGMRIDAIRECVAQWKARGDLSPTQEALLLAPLLFQCCYNSNTSGVFKGFHNGWGGKTKTALYRIMGDLKLHPVLLLDNKRDNKVIRRDATVCSEGLKDIDFAYFDPPYNQHPYGSNYHVLNSVALWDKPKLSPQITDRDKSAIRMDWRTERRSKYNYRKEALEGYQSLLVATPAKWVATSYSTDGMIGLEDIVSANVEMGETQIFMREYKRYRVSSQRFSDKPVNIEFILLTRPGKKNIQSVDNLCGQIINAEKQALARHEESASQALLWEEAA